MKNNAIKIFIFFFAAVFLHEMTQTSDYYMALYMGRMQRGGMPLYTSRIQRGDMALYTGRMQIGDYEEISDEERLISAAASSDRYGSLQRLIEKKVNLNYQNEEGETALFAAIRYKFFNNAERLLNAKADPNTPGQDEECQPISRAQFYGYMTKKLLDAKANPNLYPFLRRTINDAFDETAEVAGLLVDAKAYITGNDNGESPLLYLLKRGSRYYKAKILEAMLHADRAH